jgi:cytoskeletal protein RodZ
VEPVGERLRQAREAKGITLSEVASATKISVAALTALERGDVTRLPGGIFGRSFVRSYAVAVGLDPDVVVPDFQAEVAEAERDSARKLKQIAITPDDRAFAERQRRAMMMFRRVALAVLVIVTVAIVWGVWAWRSGGEVVPPQALPVERQAVPPPSPATVNLPAAPARPTEAAQTLRVTLEVSAACWLQITADDLVVYEQELAAGERREFTAQRALALDVGNAGVVTWTINGRDARPIGAAGVHRVVRLTPDNIETWVRQ